MTRRGFAITSGGGREKHEACDVRAETRAGLTPAATQPRGKAALETSTTPRLFASTSHANKLETASPPTYARRIYCSRRRFTTDNSLLAAHDARPPPLLPRAHALAMANPPFYVKATFEYQSGHDDDLNFHIGQVINVTEIEDDDWYVGEYTDAGGAKQDGLFPKNYVERCEPPAPPRPSRPRPKKDAAPAAEKEPAAVASTSPAAPPTPVAPTEPSPVEPKPTATEAPAPVPAPAPRAVPAAPKASPQPAPPVEQRAVPQKEEEAPPKPTGSFRDRIAAFNKPAAPPIAPKPSGASASTGFIKKPFVPPPPSRNAYVPPPRESVPPPKTYRREEDPEIAEAQAQAEKDAQDAGLAAPQAQDEEAEAPKATSLKDRIALLQRQQQEQAARRADATQKEKAPQAAPAAEEEPESHDEEEEPETVDSAPAPAPPKVPQAPPRIPPPETRRTAPESPEAHEPSDGNEADQSGAGDTTEDAGASSTEIEESEDRPRAPAPPSRTATGGLQDPVAKELEHEEAQEEEEDEMDEETRRKEELRARMAKMSGGMGMAGFFGPMPTMPAKKSSVSSDKRSATSPDARSPPPPPQRAPMVPVPGMGLPPRVQSPGTTEMSDAEESLAAPPVPSGMFRFLGPITRPGRHYLRSLLAQAMGDPLVRKAYVDCDGDSELLLVIEVLRTCLESLLVSSFICTWCEADTSQQSDLRLPVVQRPQCLLAIVLYLKVCLLRCCG